MSTGVGLEHAGGPSAVRSHVWGEAGLVQRDPCVVRSNASWVMITREPPEQYNRRE